MVNHPTMAYARMRRTSTRRRRPYRRGSTRKAVPVPRAPRTLKSRYYVRKNAYQINRISRDVRYLKMARYGAVQKNLHILNRQLTPTSTQPVLGVVNNIQADNPESGALGAPWYQLDATGTSNTVVSRFIRNDDTYWDQQNLDIVDGGIAFIHDLKLTFRLFCDPDSGVQISNKRVRIDLFKQKTRALVTPQSLGDIQQLPAVAAQVKMRNMANPTLNKFNPEYFHLIRSRFVFFNPSKTDADNKGTGAALKYVSMSVPKKYLGRVTQQSTNPQYPGGPSTSGDGFGINNMPIHQRLWVMISTDDPNTFPANEPEIKVSIQRSVTWRDTTSGSSAL